MTRGFALLLGFLKSGPQCGHFRCGFCNLHMVPECSSRRSLHPVLGVREQMFQPCSCNDSGRCRPPCVCSRLSRVQGQVPEKY